MTSSPDVETQLRTELAQSMRTMLEQGLNVGTAGNASARYNDGLLITPSGVRPAQLKPSDIAFVSRQQDALHEASPSNPSSTKPSSEWQLHQAVYDARADFNAIVHCHSRFATALACAHRSIPAVHYLVGLSGASEIPLAPYARFGSDELALLTAETLGKANACLLAHHGLVTCGDSVEAALSLAEEIEELAAVYWHTLAIGSDRVIDACEMDAVIDALHSYRNRSH